jgi:hypothetical protein
MRPHQHRFALPVQVVELVLLVMGSLVTIDRHTTDATLVGGRAATLILEVEPTTVASGPVAGQGESRPGVEAEFTLVAVISALEG